MEQSPFKTKNFKKLQDQWYKKLADSGFKDIEDTRMEEPMLFKHDNKIFLNLTPEQYSERLKYFDNARSLLFTFKFKNVLHKTVWELHCEGFSVREIETKLNRKIRKSSVNNIIQDITLKGMAR